VPLCSVLGLLQPWNKPAGKTLLVISGAASAVGAYAVRLATRLGIHPLICVAGKGWESVEELIDRIAENVVVDYRKPSLVEDICVAPPERRRLVFAFGAVNRKGSYGNICKVLRTDGGSWRWCYPRILRSGDSRGDYGEAGTDRGGFR
jgi:NADPH2:quinone reductase